MRYHHRIISLFVSFLLYWSVWRLVPTLIDDSPFLTRFLWQYNLLLISAGVLAIVGALGSGRTAGLTRYLRVLICFLVCYTTGDDPIVPALLVVAVIQEAGLTASLPGTLSIAAFSNAVVLSSVLTDRLVFGVPVNGMGFDGIVVYMAVVLPVFALSVGYLAAVTSGRRWREAVDRLDLAVSRLAEANLGYQGYAQDVRGISIAEERRRISREIHDSVGYSLTNIRVMLEASLIHIAGDRDEAVRLIGQSMDEAGLCLEQTRQAMRQLRTREIPVTSGPSAIQRLVNGFGEVTGISVSVEYGNVPQVWPLAVEKAVYRLIQEGMTNAFRHGMATEIMVFLWRDRDALRLIVRDNGSGSTEVKDGIGITGMKERVLSLGGGVDVGPGPEGFEVRAWIPMLEGEKSHVDPHSPG